MPQPYGITAIMIGMLVMLLLRAFIRPGHASLYLVPIVIVAVSYFVLAALRPRLPLYVLSIAAAELGLLFSLPAALVYHPLRLNGHSFAPLFALWSMFFALIVGLLFGYWLRIEDHPNYILPLNFLTLFVLYGFFLLR